MITSSRSYISYISSFLIMSHSKLQKKILPKPYQPPPHTHWLFLHLTYTMFCLPQPHNKPCMEAVTSSSLQASRHFPSFQIRLDFSKGLDRQTLDTSGGWQRRSPRCWWDKGVGRHVQKNGGGFNKGWWRNKKPLTKIWQIWGDKEK